MTEKTNGNGTPAAVPPELIDPTTLPEAPVSWNVTYFDRGFPCQFTMRDVSASALMPRTQKAIDWLLAKGCTPRGGSSNGGGGGAQAAKKICPIHSVEMRQRHGNGGDTWYSHKAVNPDTGQEYWCRGEQK